MHCLAICRVSLSRILLHWDWSFFFYLLLLLPHSFDELSLFCYAFFLPPSLVLSSGWTVLRLHLSTFLSFLSPDDDLSRTFSPEGLLHPSLSGRSHVTLYYGRRQEESEHQLRQS